VEERLQTVVDLATGENRGKVSQLRMPISIFFRESKPRPKGAAPRAGAIGARVNGPLLATIMALTGLNV
jgi:hypothetical protein